MKISAPSRVFWATSLPVIFAGLSETIIHVTDTIFLAQVGGAVAEFLQIMAWGIAFTSANFAYSALFVGLGRTRVLIWATLVLAITNGGLDYALVFGNLGFPALGIRGSRMGSAGRDTA